MESKSKNEKSAKEFMKLKVKSVVSQVTSSTHVSSGTMEDQYFIGHSRNSRKLNYFQASRD